jgi:hypothetical protein
MGLSGVDIMARALDSVLHKKLGEVIAVFFEELDLW